MRISKKVREEAARLLSMAACNQLTLGAAADESGASDVAVEVARLAFYDFSVPCMSDWWQTYAAAEQIVRTGWSPGDEP